MAAQAAEPGTTQLVSIGPNGYLHGDSSDASISGNGRYVAFVSHAEGLVPDSLDGLDNIFRRDLVSGVVERVTVPIGKRRFYGIRGSSSPVLSADGRYVAYMSDFGNLMEGVHSGPSHVYVRDMVTGTTVMADRAENGDPGDSWFAGEPTMSADGRYIAFSSEADNLPGPRSPFNKVFLRDLQADTITQPVEALPYRRSTPGSPTLSADGHTLAFVSTGFGLYDDRANYKHQVWVQDLRSGKVQLASGAPDGTHGNGDAGGPSLSADGTVVAFSTAARNLELEPGSRFTADVVVRDLVRGTTSLVSATPSGRPAAGDAGAAQVTADGRSVFFTSDAADVVGKDDNSSLDVFDRDLTTGTTHLVSVGRGRQATYATAYGASAVSADGSVVVFSATGLTSSPSRLDVFARTLR